MIKYIIRNDDGVYQYPRSNTGRMYEMRTTYGTDINKARLFDTKSAASNSLNYKPYSYRKQELPPGGLKIVKVRLVLHEMDEKE